MSPSKQAQWDLPQPPAGEICRCRDLVCRRRNSVVISATESPRPRPMMAAVGPASPRIPALPWGPRRITTTSPEEILPSINRSWPRPQNQAAGLAVKRIIGSETPDCFTTAPLEPGSEKDGTSPPLSSRVVHRPEHRLVNPIDRETRLGMDRPMTSDNPERDLQLLLNAKDAARNVQVFHEMLPAGFMEQAAGTGRQISKCKGARTHPLRAIASRWRTVLGDPPGQSTRSAFSNASRSDPARVTPFFTSYIDLLS